jgi:hypothetical protein
MQLLPPPEGTCPVCAVAHEPELPHNQQSLYYQYRFYGVRGRWPTWADALAHCSPAMREHWERELRAKGAWSEPEAGEPIADPPAESINQPIGDISSPNFGPEQQANDERVMLTPEEAIAMLPDSERIHTYRDAGLALVGANWDRADILDAIQNNPCELGGEHSQKAHHGLVIWVDARPLFVQCNPSTDYAALDQGRS